MGLNTYLAPEPDAIVRRIVGHEISPETKALYMNLLRFGCKTGRAVRACQEDDAPTMGMMSRLNYEEAVRVLVGEAKIPVRERNLAYDLASTAFSEGHREQSSNPGTLRKLRRLLVA